MSKDTLKTADSFDTALKEILKKPDSVKLVEYELSQALLDQGVRPNLYAELAPEAKQAIKLAFDKHVLKLAGEDDKIEVWKITDLLRDTKENTR